MSSTAGSITKERILSAALPLFADHGFAGTSTRMVAQAAGVNVATLAYHFDDKEGMYHAVVQRMHERLLAGWQGGDPPSGVSDVVEWWVASAWAFAQEHRLHLRLLSRDALDRGGHPEVVVERWAGPLLGRAESILGPFMPEQSQAQVRLFALSLLHLISRYALDEPAQLSLILGEPDDLEAEIQQFLVRYVRTLLNMTAR